jgi:hypothetical protein
MRKNTWFMAGIAAAALVFAMVFSACPQDASEEDTWSKVTKLEELNGTWKGSYSETKTMKEAMEDSVEEMIEEAKEAAGDAWTTEMEAEMRTAAKAQIDAQMLIFGDGMKVTVSAEITSTFNAAAKTSKVSGKTTMAYSGGNVDTIWESFSSGLTSSGFTVDNSKHSATMTIPEIEETLTDEDIAELLDGSIEINQDGTKVKIAAGTLDDSAPEIIMHKQ